MPITESDYRLKNPKIPKKIVFPKLNKKISVTKPSPNT